MSDEDDGKTSLEFAGVKFTGGKMFAVITALSTLVGGLYGAFEVYKDYMDMKEQIQSYVAPDLSGFHERLAVMEERMVSVEDSVVEARDYTRDIKLDIKSDVDRIESVVDDIEQTVKDIDISVRDQLQENLTEIRDLIDIADQRFDVKRDSLSTDIGRQLEDLEDRINSRLQRALDNPLAN